MTEIQLAAITTRATAALLGSLAGAGQRSIDVDPRVVFVWHVTRGGGASAVVVISRRTGKVIRGGVRGFQDGGHSGYRGKALERALGDWAWRVRGW